MSFSDTSSEREINQEEYIKQKILSCKCSEYATIKWIIKNNFTDGIGNKNCEYVACKSCSNIMSHFDSIELILTLVTMMILMNKFKYTFIIL